MTANLAQWLVPLIVTLLVIWLDVWFRGGSRSFVGLFRGPWKFTDITILWVIIAFGVSALIINALLVKHISPHTMAVIRQETGELRACAIWEKGGIEWNWDLATDVQLIRCDSQDTTVSMSPVSCTTSSTLRPLSYKLTIRTSADPMATLRLLKESGDMSPLSAAAALLRREMYTLEREQGSDMERFWNPDDPNQQREFLHFQREHLDTRLFSRTGVAITAAEFHRN